MSARLAPSAVAAPPPVMIDLLHSLRLGVRDAIRPAVLLISLLTALAAFVACTVLFVVFWPAISGFTHSLAAAALGWMGAVLAGADGVAAVLTSALSGVLIVLGWLLAIVLAYRLALEFVLMARISALVRQQYPQLQAKSGTVAARLYLLVGPLLTFALLAPLFLLLPLVGGPLLFALGGYVLVRSLMGDALEGLADGAEVRALLRRNRPGMLLLGLVLNGMVLIPPLGLLAPGLIGSCICHFACRRLQALRQVP